MCDALTTAAGDQLPDGSGSDSKLTRLHECLGKLRDGKSAKKPWIAELRDLLDPQQNASGYRIVQMAAAREGAVELALALTAMEQSDVVRSVAWECLARMAFGNGALAEEIATAAEFLPSLQRTLSEGTPPEKLSSLQLAQAVSAASGEAVAQIMPSVLMLIVPLLCDTTFKTLTEASFDFIVSCSCMHAQEVAMAVGWSQLAILVSEDERRPDWLPCQPLQILLCGRLVTNLLAGPAPQSEIDTKAREDMASGLLEGRFVDFFVECLAAAVDRREWPVGTQAYHSVLGLAEIAIKLAALGHSRRLVLAIGPLAKAIECVIDDRTSRTALRALHSLCADVVCLEALLSMTAFRKDTLEMLHNSGDEAEATELLAYLEVVELSFVGAQAALDASKTYNAHAPSVHQLADLFSRFAPLDKEIDLSQFLHAAAEIPLAPFAAVKVTLTGSSFGFQAFAERIYGTPTNLGYWPSLMEDVASALDALGDVPHLPSLVRSAELFELAGGGKSCVKGAEAVIQVLPCLGLSAEELVVEAELMALGDQDLEFKAFVEWLGQLCLKVRDA